MAELNKIDRSDRKCGEYERRGEEEDHEDDGESGKKKSKEYDEIHTSWKLHDWLILIHLPRFGDSMEVDTNGEEKGKEDNSGDTEPLQMSVEESVQIMIRPHLVRAKLSHVIGSNLDEG